MRSWLGFSDIIIQVNSPKIKTVSITIVQQTNGVSNPILWCLKMWTPSSMVLFNFWTSVLTSSDFCSWMDQIKFYPAIMKNTPSFCSFIKSCIFVPRWVVHQCKSCKYIEIRTVANSLPRSWIFRINFLFLADYEIIPNIHNIFECCPTIVENDRMRR